MVGGYAVGAAGPGPESDPGPVAGASWSLCSAFPEASGEEWWRLRCSVDSVIVTILLKLRVGGGEECFLVDIYVKIAV